VPLAVARDVRRGADVVDATTPAFALTAVYGATLSGLDWSRRQVILDDRTHDPPRYSATERIDPSSRAECQTYGHDGPVEVAMLRLRRSPPGYWREPARLVSYADVLDGIVPDGRLRDRILVVGVTAPDHGVPRDLFTIPRGLRDETVHGVELHADAMRNLATGRVVTTPTMDMQAAFALFMALFGAALSLRTARISSRRTRLLILSAVVVVYALCAVGLAVLGFLLNGLYDLAVLLIAHALLRHVQVRKYLAALARSNGS
jgi:CHASE2 domain-containing sensor protein